jgi:diguanylate cyclase (GGDEF)-like protein/PAS domain S-box-containing protein
MTALGLVAVHGLSPPLRVAGVVSLIGIIALRIREYRRPLPGIILELAEAAGFAVLALLLEPARMTAIGSVGVMFRCVQCNRQQTIARVILAVGAFAACARWTLFPSDERLSAVVVVQMVAIVSVGLLVRWFSTFVQRFDRLADREHIMSEISSSFVTARDRDAIYVATMDAVDRLLGERPALWCGLWMGMGTSMSLVASSGKALSWPIGSTLALPAMSPGLRDGLLNGELVHVESVQDALPLEPLGDDVVATFCFIPLFIRQELRGAMTVAGATSLPDEFTDVLRSLGDQTGLALERAELTEDLHARRSEARFRSLVQNSSDVIIIIDAEGRIRYQTPSIEIILGYPADSLAGTALSELFHPDDLHRATEYISRTARQEGAGAPGEWRWRHHSGEWRHMETAGRNLLDDPNIRGLVFNVRDITERKTLEQQLTHLAFHDPLTGLSNRALFRERLEHALASTDRTGEQVFVLLVDLDDFKIINDTHGHDAGDLLLVAIATRLKSCIRAVDTAARLGGDEFAVVLGSTGSPEIAVAIAERISDALRMPFAHLGREVFVRASIGIASSRLARNNPDDLLRNADLAMYLAKARGKGRCVEFQPDMLNLVMKRRELKVDLERAIEHDELILHYQPIFSLETGDVVGVEALVRWRHAERGVIPPTEFIPLAEETGLIVPIGRWVLEEACRQAKAWQVHVAGEHHFTVSVNLSARQLQEPGLARHVSETLKASGLQPNTIVLELTESAAMVDIETTLTRLHGLKAMGVKLAIDDFGTGYSSLSYLLRLHFDIMKIDRCFVLGALASGDAETLVRTIISLAQSLRLNTVAEGIELTEQLELLRGLGCELGQGYLLSKPVDADEIERLLQLSRIGLLVTEAMDRKSNGSKQRGT